MTMIVEKLCIRHLHSISPRVAVSDLSSSCLLASTRKSFGLLRVNSRPCSSSSSSDSLLTSVRNGVGLVRLNRPAAMNALTLDMIRALAPQLKAWQEEQQVRAVVVRGSGDRAFCAGGDIKAITSVPGGQIEFFQEEYQLDHLIGTLSIPYVAIMNGVTMGGGVGVAVNGRFRVATEKTVFAMPEASIGLIPDVGGGYFLPRLEGHLGSYLGLTGQRLKGWDCYTSGIATHALHHEDIEKLEDALVVAGQTQEKVEEVLDSFVPEAARNHKFSLAEHMDEINRLFSGDSVEDIVSKLEESESDIAKRALKSILSASPTSIKVAFEQLRRGAQMSSLGEVLSMELRLVTRCCGDADFYEGVRATLVDRDNKPQWNPPNLQSVTQERIDHYFSLLEPVLELKL